MSKQTKRVLAIVALVFMGVFTISLIVWFSNPNILNGVIGYLMLFSGSVGIGLFLIIKLIKTPEEKAELEKKKAEYLPTPSEQPLASQTDENAEKVSDAKNTENCKENIQSNADDTKKTL